MGLQMWWVGQENARSEATYGASNLVGAPPTVRRHFGGFSHLVVRGWWWLEKYSKSHTQPIGDFVW
jgi:hypothetical protein